MKNDQTPLSREALIEAISDGFAPTWLGFALMTVRSTLARNEAQPMRGGAA
jgi:hypothetical protein